MPPHSHGVDGFNEQLRYIRACQIFQNPQSHCDHPSLSVYDGSGLLEPDLDYPAIQNLCRAVKEARQVFCHYRSKIGAIKARTLSPLHLVYINYRYHLRAYTHETAQYTDFDLGRFQSVELTAEKAISDQEDNEWHKAVKLRFCLNPEQPGQIREPMRWEWNLREHSDITEIVVKGALKNYVIRHMTTNDYQTRQPVWILQESFDV